MIKFNINVFNKILKIITIIFLINSCSYQVSERNILKNEISRNNKSKLSTKNFKTEENYYINNPLKKNYKIFLDPGHGGKDPGAVSKTKTLEKNITLKFAKILKNSFRKYKKVKIILSRENDKYVNLRERINLAQVSDSDLFISIHVDASKNLEARGISVFTLSDRASDTEAKKLAKRENRELIDNNINLKKNDPLVLGNLIKMLQRESMNESVDLAKFILRDLDSFALYSRGHRFAGFVVLKSPQIPSVLIELGFLTNINEEKKLKNDKYLRNLSKSISLSVVKFLKYKEKNS